MRHFFPHGPTGPHENGSPNPAPAVNQTDSAFPPGSGHRIMFSGTGGADDGGAGAGGGGGASAGAGAGSEVGSSSRHVQRGGSRPGTPHGWAPRAFDV